MIGLMGMGADGSAPGLEAVVWTAREAEVRDLTLRAVHCAGPGPRVCPWMPPCPIRPEITSGWGGRGGSAPPGSRRGSALLAEGAPHGFRRSSRTTPPLW